MRLASTTACHWASVKLLQRHRRSPGAGIVEQQVQPPEPGDRRIEKPLHLRLVADIRGLHQRAVRPARGDLLQRLRPPPGERHFVTCPQQCFGSGLPDARPGAGNDGNRHIALLPLLFGRDTLDAIRHRTETVGTDRNSAPAASRGGPLSSLRQRAEACRASRPCEAPGTQGEPSLAPSRWMTRTVICSLFFVIIPQMGLTSEYPC